MAEVPFRPVRQLSEYKGKGASASREFILTTYHLTPQHPPPTPTKKILWLPGNARAT